MGRRTRPETTSWRRAFGLGLLPLCAVTLLVGIVTALPQSASAGGTNGVITEYGVPTASAGPEYITAGPDGNLWFTESNASKIGRVTTSGTFTEFSTLTSAANPQQITAGPDGNMWFTEFGADKIGRITPTGTVTEFNVPTASADPQGITAGPDGNLWFTEELGDKIGRITPSGVITEFNVPTASSEPYGITAGPDGNLWFTEFGADKIAKITTAGTVTEYTLVGNQGPQGITAGPDGNLWFTDSNSSQIGKITTTGSVTLTNTLTGSAEPQDIVAAPDGNLWFTEYLAGKVGRITTSGTVSEFTTPTGSSQPYGMTVGPDGNLWFPEDGVDKIATDALSMAGVQTTSATLAPGTLSITLGQSSVSFGSHTPNTSSGAISVGTIAYTDTLGDGLAWSASVAATDLTSGASHIPVADLSYSPSALTSGSGAVGATPTAGSGGAFSFSGCTGNPGDVSAGVSYSCPQSLMTASSSTQGTWNQNSNTATLTFPVGPNAGAYNGFLQYSVTG